MAEHPYRHGEYTVDVRTHAALDGIDYVWLDVSPEEAANLTPDEARALAADLIAHADELDARK